MKSELVYLDSSAIVKLVVYEEETPALLSFLAGHPERVSSGLARVEVFRALRRARSAASDLQRAAQVLTRIALIRVDDETLMAAADLGPSQLRSLDAIHLATALSIRSELAGIVGYDRRFSAACAKLGLPFFSPS